jgi:hypothetical protein
MNWYPINELVTTRVPGTKRVRVVYDWSFYSDRLGTTITVPAGFQFDWDSVPRWPIVYLLFKNRAIEEACAHDYLYVTGRAGCCEIERIDADQMMLDAMVYYKVKPRYRMPIYWGVRIGGWRGWNRYRKADQQQSETVNTRNEQ